MVTTAAAAAAVLFSGTRHRHIHVIKLECSRVAADGNYLFAKTSIAQGLFMVPDLFQQTNNCASIDDNLRQVFGNKQVSQWQRMNKQSGLTTDPKLALAVGNTGVATTLL
jgi:hypothetical protein